MAHHRSNRVVRTAPVVEAVTEPVPRQDGVRTYTDYDHLGEPTTPEAMARRYVADAGRVEASVTRTAPHPGGPQAMGELTLRQLQERGGSLIAGGPYWS